MNAKNQLVVLFLCISFIFSCCKVLHTSEDNVTDADTATVACSKNDNDRSGIYWNATITSAEIVDFVPAKNPQTGRQQYLKSSDGTESFLLITFDLEKNRGRHGFTTDDATLLVDDTKADYMGIFMDGEVLTMKPMQLSRKVTRDIQLCFAVPKKMSTLSLKLGASEPIALTPFKKKN